VAYLCSYVDTTVYCLHQTCYLYFLVDLQQELFDMFLFLMNNKSCFDNNTILSVLNTVLFDFNIVPRESGIFFLH
jgi:hypothetical protein